MTNNKLCGQAWPPGADKPTYLHLAQHVLAHEPDSATGVDEPPRLRKDLIKQLEIAEFASSSG
jgi:hypothetical protein